MSTTSKRRAKAREWMHAERERSKRDSIQSAERAREREAESWKRRLTLTIPPDENGDTFYPQGRIEHLYVRVYAPKRQPVERFDPRDSLAPRRVQSVDAYVMRARQMAHVLPNGAKVVWWTWEVSQ